MENILISNYLSIIDRLDIDAKLALLSALTDNIRESVNRPRENKMELLDKLYGSWADVDDGIIDDIYSNRAISDREITFD